jgi:hypothetical protein
MSSMPTSPLDHCSFAVATADSIDALPLAVLPGERSRDGGALLDVQFDKTSVGWRQQFRGFQAGERDHVR